MMQPDVTRVALWLVTFCQMFVLAGCGGDMQGNTLRPEAGWHEIVDQSLGQTVRLSMWDGDPAINTYMRDYVSPELKRQYNVDLVLLSAQGQAIINKLIVDKEAHRSVGDIDLIWINGESFYQLRRIDALYGPFTDRLPNNQYLDWDDPFVASDFQQPVEGYECPWGNVQFIMIYNRNRVAVPPANRHELADWIRAHPGRFTFDNGFTGMTFLKGLLFELADHPQDLSGPFNEPLYQSLAEKLWQWLKEVRPFLWRKGETYPESVSQLHQLFMNGEVDFTMSNNDGEVDNKVLQAMLPDSSQGYVMDAGSIRNSHYLGIPFNAPNKAGALVVLNFLISPEAQWRKATPAVWGDGTVLSTGRLPDEWKAKFETIDGRVRVASRAELQRKALQEPVPEIMVRLHTDFRREMIRDGR